MDDFPTDPESAPNENASFVAPRGFGALALSLGLAAAIPKEKPAAAVEDPPEDCWPKANTPGAPSSPFTAGLAGPADRAGAPPNPPVPSWGTELKGLVAELLVVPEAPNTNPWEEEELAPELLGLLILVESAKADVNSPGLGTMSLGLVAAPKLKPPGIDGAGFAPEPPFSGLEESLPGMVALRIWPELNADGVELPLLAGLPNVNPPEINEAPPPEAREEAAPRAKLLLGLLAPNMGENPLVAPIPLPSALVVWAEVNLSTFFTSESLLWVWIGDPIVIPPVLAEDPKLNPGAAGKDEETVVAASPGDAVVVISNMEPPLALGAQPAGGAPNWKPEPEAADDGA